MRLQGKVAVITGAAGTLGRALASAFLGEGCEGVVLTDVDAEALASAAGAVDGDVLALPCDVRDPAAVDAVVDAAVERHGRVDVVVNNAGVLAPNRRLHNLSVDDWRRVLDVNLMGVVHGTAAALRVMRPRRSGAIVNTASIAGVTAWSHSGPYCVSKAGVIQLTRATALEYAAEGIRANCVCPGSFESAMFAGVPQAAVDVIATKHPLGLGGADALVGAFVYLASEEARWTTGASLVVDGGYSVP